MSAERQFPSREHVESTEFEAVASDVHPATCCKLSSIFFQKSQDSVEAGNLEEASVYRFLGQLTFIELNSGDDERPLRPGLIATTGRSSDINDFDEEALEIIEILRGSSIPAIRARCGDILWLRKKNHQAAADAAEAYLEEYRAADDGENWVLGIDGLSRGMNLARMLGDKRPLFENYTVFIHGRINALKDSCEDAHCARLIELFIDHHVGDPASLAAIAESIGCRLIDAGSDFLGRQYLDQAIVTRQRARDGENVHRVKRLKGDSLVSLAERCAAEPGQGFSSAAHHLAMGIECLRQGRADVERRKTLHKKLLEWQLKAQDEMQTHFHETNISDLVDGVRKTVAGMPLQDAIFAMARGRSPIDVDSLRERVIQQAGEFPLASLFSVTMLASDGRVIGHKPALIHNGVKQQEEAVEAEMFHQASMFDWGFRAQAYIDVCRRQIWDEHRPSYPDLQFLVLQNPFVPRGHEMLFLKGIVAGFRGDFDIVAHLLVPQIEESLRYVLKNAGHITSKLDPKLIQEERSLGTLLEMPEALDIFGRNNVFELRGLLCADFGFGLRNRLAHGFLTYNESWGIDVINLWWLVIRLLCSPHATATDNLEDPEPDSVDTADGGTL
jgi:hypothetical protein